jgi:hypothetical protein
VPPCVNWYISPLEFIKILLHISIKLLDEEDGIYSAAWSPLPSSVWSSLP